MSMGKKVGEGVQLAVCSQSEGVGTVAVDVRVGPRSADSKCCGCVSERRRRRTLRSTAFIIFDCGMLFCYHLCNVILN